MKTLCFGDLHLEDIRAWREATFSPHYPCRFPIFGVPYSELMSRLWTDQQAGVVSIAVSAVREDLLQNDLDNSLEDSISTDTVAHEVLKIGAPFTAALIAHLPPGCDEMGENGEFHTHVTIAKADTRK